MQQAAAGFGAEVGGLMRSLFRPLLPWFSAVSEVPITRADFRHSRLGRTSRFYRDALRWAELILAGSDLPAASGKIPPLVLDANAAFERFAEVVVRSAIQRREGQRAEFQETLPFLRGVQTQGHRPDIIVRDARGVLAVGDSKYKEVLEKIVGQTPEDGEEVARACVESPDWNQLYVYMRLTQASAGFFVVPFWNADGPVCNLVEPFEFDVSPCDGAVRVAILALNLLRPLTEVRREAGELLGRWIDRGSE